MIGSKKWMEEKFGNWDAGIEEARSAKVFENGHDFSQYLVKEEKKKTWDEVILVKRKNGLEMKVADKADLSCEFLLKAVGKDEPIATVDVFNQKTVEMRFGEFMRMFETEANRDSLYNILSIEMTNIDELKHLFLPPKVVREMSVVDQLWERRGSETRSTSDDMYLDPEFRPNVEEVLLLSMAGSFTDWHIDFGGSSVFYHVLKGRKIFYLAPPTTINIRNYSEHMKRKKKSENWFGSRCTNMTKITVNEGQTAFIPSGWIHAVYTPEDSVVFAGNFLSQAGIEMQLRVHKIERSLIKMSRVDDRFSFPNFEFVQWQYANFFLFPMLKEKHEEGIHVKTELPMLFQGVKILIKHFEQWLRQEDSNGEDQKSKRKLCADLKCLLDKNEKMSRKSETSRRRRRHEEGAGPVRKSARLSANDNPS